MVVIAEVVAGKEPVQALFGLPIGATIAWFFIRSGIKTKRVAIVQAIGCSR
jgi:hypothetical protein